MANECGDLDSWEDQADSGLFDKRLDEMSVEIQQSSEKKGVAPRGQMFLSDDTTGTQYQPKVRILKRDSKAPPPPTDGNRLNSSAGGSSKANKTLQQREAEYAEARMRIFGCVPPDDDEEEGEDTSSSGDKNNSSVIQGVPQIFKSVNGNNAVPVIRQPRGPDGTSGFNKPDHT